MPSRRFIAFSIGVCLACGLQAQPDPAPTPEIDCQRIDNETTPPRTYWTKERMQQAQLAPLPWSGDGDGEMTGDMAASRCEPNGHLFLTEISKHPYASAGRLFFFNGTRHLSCTAAFTESNRTLLTAAHCVRADNGKWNTLFYFVQGYDEGQGQGVELELVATWHKYLGPPKVNRAFDYAFFYTKDLSSSRKWLQLGTPDPHSFWLAIGYVDNPPSEREKLVQIMGPRGKLDPAGGLVKMEGNPMVNGSGGAWIANASMCSSACNEVVGLTASLDLSICQLNSPLFNDETRQLWKHVRQQCRKE